MTEEPDENHEGALAKIVPELAVHILATTAAFLLIFGAALFLDVLVDWLIHNKIVEYGTGIYWALWSAKYILLMADLTFLIVLVYKLTLRAIKNI